MKNRKTILIVVCFLVATDPVNGQDAILDLFKNSREAGDEYFESGMYAKALEYYEAVRKKDQDKSLYQNMARSYYYTRQYEQALVMYYALNQGSSVDESDAFAYAEIQMIVGNLESARAEYRKLLERMPENPVILKKLWQLDQRELFYEDSSRYSVRSLEINSPVDDVCAVPFDGGLAFLSNRVDLTMSRDEQSGMMPLQVWYAPAPKAGKGKGNRLRWPQPAIPSFPPHSGFHAVTFLQGEKCIYAATSHMSAADGTFKTQLYQTSRSNGKWGQGTLLSINDGQHNLTQPCLSSGGETLYFSADIPGGYGGFDLYKSEWTGAGWSTPENLGDQINTPYDEGFPFLNGNTLYFSSNGHAGLGGMDIFSLTMENPHLHEVTNAGYPINSPADDIGIHLVSSSGGYFSSNRDSRDFKYDIYEFGKSTQSFPFDISGAIFAKASDTEPQSPMPDAPIQLVDITKNEIIATSMTGHDGTFEFSIPRFSRYVLRITDNDGKTYDVSLEVDPDFNNQSTYEVVVVREWQGGTDRRDTANER